MPSLAAKQSTTSFDWADPRRSSSTTALMLARQEVQRKKRLDSVKPTIGGQYGGSLTNARKPSCAKGKGSKITLKSIVRKTASPADKYGQPYRKTKLKKAKSNLLLPSNNQETSVEKPSSSSSNKDRASSKESRRNKLGSKKKSRKPSSRQKSPAESSSTTTEPTMLINEANSILSTDNALDLFDAALDNDEDIFPQRPTDVPEVDEDDEYLQDEFEEEESTVIESTVLPTKQLESLDLSVPENEEATDGIVSVESSFCDGSMRDESNTEKQKRILELNSRLAKDTLLNDRLRCAAEKVADQVRLEGKFPVLELKKTELGNKGGSVKSLYIRKSSLKQLKKPSPKLLDEVEQNEDNSTKEVIPKKKKTRSELRSFKSRHSLTDLRNEHEEALAMLKEIDESPRLGTSSINEKAAETSPKLKVESLKKDETTKRGSTLISAALSAAESELEKSMSTYDMKYESADEKIENYSDEKQSEDD